MQLPIQTTLADIREEDPCAVGFTRIRYHLGVPSEGATRDREPFPVALLLETNGLDDALWVLDHVICNRRICSLLAADYAERVLHLFEEERPGDDGPRKAIEVARNADASQEDRAAVMAVVGDAGYAARNAWSALNAAWSALNAAGAALNAAGAAARAAKAGRVAGTAKRAEWAAQERRLRQYLQHGESAASMPWPEPAKALK